MKRATGAGSAASVGRRTGGNPALTTPSIRRERRNPMTATSPATSARPDYTDIGKALGTDYFLLRAELTAEERDYLERTRRFVHEEVLPVINAFWERAEVPVDLCRRLGEAGRMGGGLEGLGGPAMRAAPPGCVTLGLRDRGS